MLTRLFPHPGLTAMLIVVWMLLLNSFTIGGLFLAIVFAIIVPVLTAPFWPDRPRLRLGWAMIDYLLIVIFDIFVANFQIAWLILFRRSRDLRSRWLVIPLELRSAEAISTLAGTISFRGRVRRWPRAARPRAGCGGRGCRSRPHQAPLRGEAAEDLPMIAHALTFGFGCVAVAVLLNLYRLLRGPTRGDRILSLDTMVINTIALIILFGIDQATTTYFEAALLLAMVGFVGTVAYCKFLLRGDIVE
jgi:multicomponent K+:H+ antiporter subunit E